MAKTKISEFSATAADNTDITNINIAEGCSPANVNNAIRSLMAILKSFEDGSSGDSVVVGGNLSVTGTTTLTGTPTAPTQSSSDNSTKLATTAFVTTKLSTLGTMSTQNATAVAITGGTITGITDLDVADGGTGASTLSANAVLLGNGTSALQTVAPSTSGNVLTSNGTTWTSAAPTSGIGVGQTWQNVSRALGTVYTNSTGKPIFVQVMMGNTVNTTNSYLTVGGVIVSRFSQDDNYTQSSTLSAIVPNNTSYSVTTGGAGLVSWVELR